MNKSLQNFFKFHAIALSTPRRLLMLLLQGPAQFAHRQPLQVGRCGPARSHHRHFKTGGGINGADLHDIADGNKLDIDLRAG